MGYSRCFDHLAARKNIRVCTLCPAFVDTPLVQSLLDDPKAGRAGQMAIDELGGLIPMEKVVDAFMELVENDEHVGTVMTVTNKGGAVPARFP